MYVIELKPGESFTIDKDIVIKLQRTRGYKARLCVKAPETRKIVKSAKEGK